jgi:hypothetical protein
MPQFTLPNVATGGSITVTANDLSSAQQAAANQTGVSLGAQQGGGTYGANSLGGGTGGGGGGGGGGYSAAPDYSGGLAQFAAQTSGVTQAQLAQQKAEFDAQLQFARDQMQQLGIPQLQINQFLAQMQQRQFQSQLALAAQAQAYSQAATTAGLTGWYQAPQSVPDISQYLTQQTIGGAAGVGGGTTDGGGGAGGQQAYIQARTQQLMSVAGMGQAQAQQTAQSEWSQGNAQTGNVAYGLPSGFTPGAQTAGGGTGGAANSQDQYIAARTAQLQQVAGMSAEQAQQTAQAEWAQGNAQTGNVAYGMPSGLSSTAAQLSGMYQGSPTEQAREFNRQLALQQGQLGQQYLATASQLTGPQNTFQLSNYLRGAQGNQAVPTYLQSLANNIGMPGFQGTGSTAPTPQTAAGLIGQMGGAGGGGGAQSAQGPQVWAQQYGDNLNQQTGQLNAPTNWGSPNVSNMTQRGAGYQQASSPQISSDNLNQQTGQLGAPTNWGSPDLSNFATQRAASSATPGWDYNQTLGTIRGIMGQGAQSLGPGALERLSPDELQAFGSGLGQAGGSLPSFLQQYQQSRIGQQAPTQTSLA